MRDPMLTRTFTERCLASPHLTPNRATPTRRRCRLTVAQLVPALKEWAPIVAAVLDGAQTVLFRKGGIREPTFVPRAPTFLLFPTAYHTDRSLLKPDAQLVYQQECGYDPRNESTLAFSCLVKTTGLWRTTCGDVLSALEPLHICGPEFLENRLKWRPSQSLTVIQVRAYRLPKSIEISPGESYWGCFSWVDLPINDYGRTLLGKGVPVATDEEYAHQSDLCEQSMLKLPNTVKLPISDSE